MNESDMLHKMCREILSDADVKAICKSRGFSAQEASSRALFENFFLSEIGLETALASLTAEEIVLLHLLNLTDEVVDVGFFARIYGEGVDRYGTFNQKYKGVFKNIKNSMVRKGALLMADAEDLWGVETKIERWRFRFPRQFGQFLPSLIKAKKTTDQAGELRPDVLRRKLEEIVKGKTPFPDPMKKAYALKIEDGEIRIGNSRFSAYQLLKWQQACWERAAPSKGKKERARSADINVSPTEAATYTLQQLGKNEWLRPNQLSTPLKIFCQSNISAEDLCAAGWEWGCVVRNEVDGEICYRLPDEDKDADVDPGRYLDASPAGHLLLDLKTVPFLSLEHLVRISDIYVPDSRFAKLSVAPNIIKMGRAPEPTWDLALVEWLRKNSPDFAEAMKKLEQRKGKRIIHENLLIARITDLTLKIKIEGAFPAKVASLSDDYIAFPHQLEGPIEKLLTKLGHVVRTIEYDD